MFPNPEIDRATGEINEEANRNAALNAIGILKSKQANDRECFFFFKSLSVS